jgi:DNA-binding phage protein
MNTEEIKSWLYEGIEDIDDNEFLLAIKELIERKYNTLDIAELSELQLERIKDSERQIENGDSFTNEQVDKIIDKWLEE